MKNQRKNAERVEHSLIILRSCESTRKNASKISNVHNFYFKLRKVNNHKTDIFGLAKICHCVQLWLCPSYNSYTLSFFGTYYHEIGTRSRSTREDSNESYVSRTSLDYMSWWFLAETSSEAIIIKYYIKWIVIKLKIYLNF
jgi:hypothetical protein